MYLFDYLISPFVFLGALILVAIRRVGIEKFPVARQIFLKVGVFPISSHYYEPLFDHRKLKSLGHPRNLPGINWNVAEQLEMLESFKYQNELMDVSAVRVDDSTFYIGNPTFGSGDAEFLYNLIRTKKPRKFVEIGSGNSTLMAIKAIQKNAMEDSGYKCSHICIEPYEMPWLETVGVEVVRQKVEDIGSEYFSELEENDILFIDSSHIIRPQGDVLFEFLELLPSLRAGVIVHVHDIFSPRDYPKAWIVDQVRMWNEQYLFESFLTSNHDWKILGAVNFLHHEHYDLLKSKCPFLTNQREPGSFYIQKTT